MLLALLSNCTSLFAWSLDVGKICFQMCMPVALAQGLGASWSQSQPAVTLLQGPLFQPTSADHNSNFLSVQMWNEYYHNSLSLYMPKRKKSFSALYLTTLHFKDMTSSPHKVGLIPFIICSTNSTRITVQHLFLFTCPADSHPKMTSSTYQWCWIFHLFVLCHHSWEQGEKYQATMTCQP